MMVPVAEYHPSEDGTDYVLFRCFRCEIEEKRDWDSYWRYRPQSFDCAKCGKRVWGATARECPDCHTATPRVARFSWNPGQSKDRPSKPGFLYTPAEWAELNGRKALGLGHV